VTAHHLPESMLATYAAGGASEAEAVLVASHLTLCPACRARLADMEAVGGALLDQSPRVEQGLDELLASTLAALDESDQPAPEPAPRVDPSGTLPAPLAQLVGPVDQLSWQRVFPGVERIEIDAIPSDGMPLRLFRLKPDMRVPDHAHRGREISLVLTGGFSDDVGHYQRGDVCERGEEAVHRQHIDPGDPCVVLVLADHPLIAKTLRGQLARLLHRL